MAKDTIGKAAEQEFRRHWAKQGKGASLHRFTDASDLYGMNRGKAGNVPAQPADFLLCIHGATSLGEVKATADLSGFPLKNISGQQLGRAEMWVAAGGSYFFWVRRVSPTLAAWYKVPAATVLLRHRSNAHKLLTWAELEQYRVHTMPGRSDEPNVFLDGDEDEDDEPEVPAAKPVTAGNRRAPRIMGV